jgi:CheY-like chemotaxis protein
MFTRPINKFNNYLLNDSKIQNQKNVLVFEDDNVSITKVNYTLNGIGEFNVTNNELIALAMIKEKKYDLILIKYESEPE